MDKIGIYTIPNLSIQSGFWMLYTSYHLHYRYYKSWRSGNCRNVIEFMPCFLKIRPSSRIYDRTPVNSSYTYENYFSRCVDCIRQHEKNPHSLNVNISPPHGWNFLDWADLPNLQYLSLCYQIYSHVPQTIPFAISDKLLHLLIILTLRKFSSLYLGRCSNSKEPTRSGSSFRKRVWKKESVLWIED